jgi:hypothetical protein
MIFAPAVGDGVLEVDAAPQCAAGLSARWVRVAAVAVTLGDPSVLVVDAELGLLTATHLPPVRNRLPFRVEVAGHPVRAPAPNIPAPAVGGDDMMGVGSPSRGHMVLLPVLYDILYAYSEHGT